MGEFTQQRCATGAVVRSQKDSSRIDGILIREGPRIVVGTEENSVFAIRMPLDDQIAHAHFMSIEWMAGVEFLQRDLSAELLKMRRQEFLLPPHALRSRDAGAKSADFLQIAVRPLAIYRNVAQLQL